MKKLLSLALCALLLLTPVLGAAAEENASLMDQLWGVYDLSFLVDWGVLTEDEAAMLSAEKAAVEAGREVVHTAKITTGPMAGEEVTDETLAAAALLERVTFVERAQRNETTLALLLDGEEAINFSLGEQDGLFVLGSNLLPGAVSLNAADLETLPTRLVTAAQANGLISSQEAMQFGMMMGGGMTPFGMAMPWWVQLIGMEVDVSALDLTAWNAVLAGLQARMTYADGADGLQTWSVTVTPEDVTDFLYAALVTVRDNPALADMIAGVIEYDRMAMLYGDMGSFTEEVIDPLLAEMDGGEVEVPLQLDITGHVDAQGEIVRLEIDMLDTSMTSMSEDEASMLAGTGADPESFADYFTIPSEPEPMLTIVYNRRTAENETVQEVRMSDGEYVTFAEYHEAPGSYAIILGDESEGVRTEQVSVSFDWSVVRDDDATVLKADFLYQHPTTDYNWNENGRFEYTERVAELSFNLEANISATGYSIVMTGLNTENEPAVSVSALMDCAVDGVDLVGTEHMELKHGDNVVFSCAADLRTQEPAGSILAGEALRLADMTDKEMADWVAQVKANAEAWYAAQQNGWVGDLVELMNVPAPEVEADVVYTLKGDEISAMLGNVYALETSGLDDWSAEIVEGADVVEFDDVYLTLDEENPEESEVVVLFFTGLKEGEATVVVTEHSTTDDHPEGVYRITTIRLAVDAEGIVEMLERSTRTEYGVTVQ